MNASYVDIFARLLFMNFSQAQDTDENIESSEFSNIFKFNSFSDGIGQSSSAGSGQPNHHQHHSEPPTPPRTPIINSGLTSSASASVAAAVTDLSSSADPTHHASAVAVSAIIENFQQTLNERIIRLHREGIAASTIGDEHAAEQQQQQRSIGDNSGSNGGSGSNGSPKITVTPASKLMDTTKLRRVTRPSSPMDVVPSSEAGACDSFSEQDYDEDTSRAFDLSFRYTDDSNLSPSGACSEEDRYSETGTGVDSLNDASSYDSIRASSSYKTSDGNSFGGGDKSTSLVSLNSFFLMFISGFFFDGFNYFGLWKSDFRETWLKLKIFLW